MTEEFDRPEYAVLWRQARTAVARGQVKLGYKAPDPAAASAVSGLLGRELTAGVGTTIPVADLDDAVRSRFHCGLSDVLGAVFGEQAAAVPAAAPDEADRILFQAMTDAGVSGDWVPRWVDQARRYAKIAPDRLATAARQAAAIVASLHLDSSVPPPSWEVRSDLAQGHRLTGLVLRAAALAHGVPLPRQRGEEKRLWERCGVLLDGVSTTILTWAFPGFDDRNAQGLPTHLTIRDRVPSGLVAAVCTSPRTIDAAIAAGIRTPLLCLSGHVNPVTRQVLSTLSGARVHSDFDAHGLLIAQQALSLTNGTPWRMTADDYRAALSRARQEEIDLPALDAAPPATPWDPDLTEAMRAGWAVPEDVVIAELLTDLG
ncbi:TIGR02679 domain-containing protein [Actinokineospora enzanensis]|uniref:TIGR02679 domain-containing protein n=1 Tax=Actinokineospora enzanensis TaxID=155975 RepID=UPI000374D897|nr:DUF2399 domain-containing protein [Actinokineospora enzanensis]